MSRAPAAVSSTYQASDGAAYERFMGRWTARLGEPFAEFARLPDGDRLDVGCGTGSLAAVLARTMLRGQVVGIDLSAPYVAYARAHNTAERLSFETADACSLRFAEGCFAAALAQLVLNFVPDAEAAAAEMRRVTRPGGVVAAAVWDFRGGLVYQRLFWDTAAGLDPTAGAARDRLFSHALALPDGLPQLWRRIGLAGIERASLTVRMDYASFADYWQPLLGGQGPLGSYVQGLPPDMRKTLEARVKAAYLSGAPDGPRSLAASAWAVRGVVV